MLILFDVDGTLDCSGGTVPVDRLRELALAGYTIIIVSPSSARPKGFHEILSRLENRRDSLEEVKRKYPEEKLGLYVSDNPGDDVLARELDFCYIHPSNFC